MIMLYDQDRAGYRKGYALRILIVRVETRDMAQKASLSLHLEGQPKSKYAYKHHVNFGSV